MKEALRTRNAGCGTTKLGYAMAGLDDLGISKTLVKIVIQLHMELYSRCASDADE